MEEAQLIRACQAGDPEAFGELYDRVFQRVYSFVYFKTRHKETAEDLTSETFWKALRKIETCDPGRPFISWVYAIAHNTIRDHYRSKSSRPNVDIDDVWDLSDDEIDITADTDTKLLGENASKYLKRLKAHERDIIIMRIWQELSYKEIATITGKSEGALKMSFSRALGKLRESMPAEAFVGVLLIRFF